MGFVRDGRCDDDVVMVEVEEDVETDVVDEVSRGVMVADDEDALAEIEPVSPEPKRRPASRSCDIDDDDPTIRSRFVVDLCEDFFTVIEGLSNTSAGTLLFGLTLDGIGSSCPDLQYIIRGKPSQTTTPTTTPTMPETQRQNANRRYSPDTMMVVVVVMMR
jgi:hypothetical protein